MASWIKRVFNKLLGRKTEEPQKAPKISAAQSSPKTSGAGRTLGASGNDDWASNPLNPLHPLNPIFNTQAEPRPHHHHAAPAPTTHHHTPTHSPTPDPSTHHHTTTVHHDTSTYTHHSTSFDFGGGFSHHH